MVEARNLPKVQYFGGKANPYVIMSCGTSEFKTKTKKQDLNPKWDERFELKVKGWTEQKIKLKFRVKSEVFMGRDDFMGGTEVKLLPGVNLKPGKIFEQWWE